MKNVILLTSQFPFEKGESFVAPELSFAQKNGCDLEIVAVNKTKEGEFCHPVPEGIKCGTLFKKPFSPFLKAFFTISCFFKKHFWQELSFLRKKGKLSPATLRNLTAFVSRGARIAKALEKKYGSILKKSPGNTVFYSYWMVDFCYASALLAKKYGVKAVTRAHGGDLYAERHKGGYAPMRRFLIDNLDGIYPVSTDGERYIKAEFGDRQNVITKRLGSFNKSGERTACNKDTLFRVVTCAYIIPLKRLPLIAKALCEITDRAVEWVHFGDGPNAHELLEQTHSLPDNISFVFMGNRKNTEIMEFYRTNDVHLFVNASSTEGLPVSIMEAASFGIPVIATDVGGTHEVVHHGGNGFLVSPNPDAGTLAQEIRKVIYMETNDYAALRKNARALWECFFDAEKNYDEFYRII